MEARHLAAIVALALLLASPSRAADPLPEGPGLASKYPGDRGIAEDPAVLFADDFEEGTIEDIKARWGEASDRDGEVLALSEDVPFPDGGAEAGRRSLKMTATPGKDTGGHLFTRLPRGVDRAFARFYVKFPEPPNYIHHFFHFGGYNPPTGYPQGGAGSRPEGDDRVTVGVEPFGLNGREPAPGVWNLYTYWHEMKRSGDGRYWGNALHPVEKQPVPAGRWQCVEVMLELNTPGERDGALALWIDGNLVADIRKGVARGPWTGLGFVLRPSGEESEPFEGFDFRTTEDLKVNFLWLLHYFTDQSSRRNRAEDPDRPNSVWFDHIVVATDYIGPVTPQ